MIYTKLAEMSKEVIVTRSTKRMPVPTTVVDLETASSHTEDGITVLDLSNPRDVAMVTEAGYTILDLSTSFNSAASDCGSSDTVSVGTDDISDLDPEIAKAAVLSAETGSLTPLIKEELKYSIQKKRLEEGKAIIKVDTSQKRQRKEKLSTEEEMRRQRRRERNKVAAQKCRSKRKEKADDLNEQSLTLEEANDELRDEIEKLEHEKEMLFNMLRTHDICPRSCNTRLSACSDGESGAGRSGEILDAQELDIQMELEVMDTQAESPFSVALMGIDPLDDELEKDVFSN